MKVKTYGINGLTDWYGEIKVNSISVKVSFTGGTVSPSGAQPAYFITKNPITQFVIENSKEFKSGFISLQMVQEISGEHPMEAKPSNNQNQNQNEKGESAENENEKGDGAAVAENGGKRHIKVADKPDAVEWLKENYPDKGYTGLSLKSKAAFEAACEECGVEFEFAE